MKESLTVDSTLSHYRIVSKLGAGGMGEVWLAEDTVLGRQVALKLLPADVMQDADRVRRFLQEAKTASALNHPNIITIHEIGQADGAYYLVTEYIDGQTLRQRMRAPMPLGEVLRVAEQIAKALSAPHAAGIVHRDIKPENVMLRPDGLVKILDFGLAKLTHPIAITPDTSAPTDAGGWTAPGVVMGTVNYMSPEQARGLAIDARTDIWSLGCVMYEMVAGSRPFEGATGTDVIVSILQKEPVPLTRCAPEVPAEFGRIVTKALAKDRDERYPTGHDLALDLKRLRQSLEVQTDMRTPTDAPRAATPNNLPGERTRFIGRDQELQECERLFGEMRLITLTGTGGCGKTRLALKFAERMLDRCPDGVWFVDLAPLMEGNRVADTVAAAVGVREEAEKNLIELLGQHVRERRLLLLLDNCEHLLSACAELADVLLTAGRDLRILATSREGLGVQGERLFALSSLAVPAAEAAADLPSVASSEAVQLFVDRAQLALREFALTEKNAASVAEICRQLDGIPLAIELAAARVKILSVDQIRARLDDRFRLLTGGSRTALPRHQTLRATIQWSYDQLSEEEQRLFRRLSVFAGGWTLDLVTRVAFPEADEFEVLDLLTHLVDKSLVLVEGEEGDERRYGLLETVRQYAQERLAEAGEAEAARWRHFEAFLDLAERAYAERFPREEHWAAVLEAEHDNLGAALNLARQSDSERHLQLAGALAWFFQLRSHLLEGREHLTAALAATAPDPPRRAWARALWGAANTIAWQGEGAAALPLMEEALAVWRALGDLAEVALALEGIGWAQFLGGEDEAACATFAECLRLQREGGDPVLINRAMVALAQTLVALHRVEEAHPMVTAVIAFSKSHGDRRSEHFGWHFLADCALIEGKCEESLTLYQKSLALAQALGDRLETSFEVQGVAMSLAGLGEAEQSLRLASSAKAEWERIGVDIHLKFWDALLDDYLGRARRALGTETAERVWQEGKLIPFDEAVAAGLRQAWLAVVEEDGERGRKGEGEKEGESAP